MTDADMKCILEKGSTVYTVNEDGTGFREMLYLNTQRVATGGGKHPMRWSLVKPGPNGYSILAVPNVDYFATKREAVQAREDETQNRLITTILHFSQELERLRALREP